MKDCYLSSAPNEWGCHDPQCGDSTWDHDCPVGPCTLAEHGNAPAPTTTKNDKEEVSP